MMVFITAYFLGMAAAIPMGPVGSLLLRVRQERWYACLASILALDLVLAFLALMTSNVFIKVSSAPLARLLSGVFLLVFAVHGLVRQTKNKNVRKKHSEASVKRVVTMAAANPGTYLMVASAFFFLDMHVFEELWLKWLVLGALSLGSISWYHLVRHFFLKQSAKFQHRFEKIIFLVIAASGVFTLVNVLAHDPHLAELFSKLNKFS